MDQEFMKFLNELEGVSDRIENTNKQRMTMALLLTNLMKHHEVSLSIKASIAATIMDMLDECMIPEDGPLKKLFNDAIDSVCEESKEHGVSDLRGQLNKIRKDCNEAIKRQKDGENILKSLNLDDINLN